MNQLTRRALLAGLLATTSELALAQSLRRRNGTEVPPVEPVSAPHDMVVSQEAKASRIGAAILEKGGNAVDAAVAVGYALAVTYPVAGNIGGGGFMVIHLADKKLDTTIDYRETAPAAVTRNAFLDARGQADPKKSRELGSAVGVPGTVAGLAMALEKYGSKKFTLAELIQPAIELARGFAVDDALADSLTDAQPRLSKWPATAKIFMKDGKTLAAGDTLVQSDLAGVLEAIAQHGPKAFYEGPIADRIVAAVRGASGAMTAADLKGYRAVERRPVRGRYRGYDIVSMPPPSSGGVILIEMLNILEGFNLRTNDPTSVHLLIETMKRAYADRAQFLGDPSMVRVPVAGLTSKRYAASLRAEIDPQRARPARDIRWGNPAGYESHQTTHYSIVDRFGNAVSNTYTLNLSYGVGLVADGTGILLNNELDDFAAAPGVPNAYGLVGFDANAPGPRKRPLSSMTPAIVLKNGKPYLVTGSPGGSRIITTVLQVILNVIDHHMPIAEATYAPRVHHQWWPDEVLAERGTPETILKSLEAHGHTVIVTGPATSANSILMAADGPIGAADTRTRGALAFGQ